jgi:LAO/AO transport system kinase
MLAGDRVALGRLGALVEQRASGVAELMSRVRPRTGRAQTIRLTGPAAAGKSRVGDRLIEGLRATGRQVGLVTVEPARPLGGTGSDTVTGHVLDPGVFTRALPARRERGEAARAARDLVWLLDAYGMDTVLVETRGFGEGAAALRGSAETTIVVLSGANGPAGTDGERVFDVADIVVVNVPDGGDGRRLQSELTARQPASAAPGWTVPIVMVQATGNGVEALLARLDEHRVYLRTSPLGARRDRARREAEFLDVLEEEVGRRLARGAGRTDDGVGFVAEAVRRGSVDPYTAALRLLGDADTMRRLLGEDG